MNKAQDYYPDCPEVLIVNLARTGDPGAFEELVRRHQSSVRNLMRRCCNDVSLADDLAQQVFLTVWLNIRTLREANAFASWLKKLAISIWLQHLRKNDALRNAGVYSGDEQSRQPFTGLKMDLDEALATLPEQARLCVVLSYHEGMSHGEIASATKLPLGTVKSHIHRGAERLKTILSAYDEMTNVAAES
ncbi:MAG: sigma-70 family RNA polymerase sigma factor [Proteobacteria bacterium]|nr:sigma-70 family RNA polymerase sigma factor [Pseudomonadota bacterium]